MSRQQQPDEREADGWTPEAEAEYAEYLRDQERDRKMIEQWEQEQAQ